MGNISNDRVQTNRSFKRRNYTEPLIMSCKLIAPNNYPSTIVMQKNLTEWPILVWVGIYCACTILSPIFLVLVFSFIVWPKTFTLINVELANEAQVPHYLMVFFLYICVSKLCWWLGQGGGIIYLIFFSIYTLPHYLALFGSLNFVFSFKHNSMLI